VEACPIALRGKPDRDQLREAKPKRKGNLDLDKPGTARQNRSQLIEISQKFAMAGRAAIFVRIEF
jgi:hypothetical protein